MISRNALHKLIDDQMARHYRQYGHDNMAKRLVIDYFSGYIKGYHKHSGSNQQVIEQNGKTIYNSDTDALSDNQLVVLLIKTIDRTNITIKKPEWVVRIEDSRIPKDYEQYPYSYFMFKVRTKAEENAQYMKTLPFVGKITLMKETMPNQYVNTQKRDYQFIKKIR
jgi:hypothetical protein